MIQGHLCGQCAIAVFLTMMGLGAPAQAQTSSAAAHAWHNRRDAASAPSPPGEPAAAEGESTQASGESPAADVLLDPEGGNVWGSFLGYGFNQSIYGSAGGIDIATAGVRWSRLWRARGSSFFRGHPGLGLEFVPLMSFVEPQRNTWALGANLLYEYHFAATGRLMPIWRAGVGLVYATRPVPQSETRGNFSVLTDLGVDVVVTNSSAIFLGYRFHHVSNAGTGPVNPGINVHSVIFGLSLYR